MKNLTCRPIICGKRFFFNFISENEGRNSMNCKTYYKKNGDIYYLEATVFMVTYRSNKMKKYVICNVQSQHFMKDL